VGDEMSYEELAPRKMRILKAIVDDYIQSMEPVGSRTIAKKYEVGLSSATIRNEMADLEDMGYLSQPYSSAGRVPSDKGYRIYVDHLIEIDESKFSEYNRLLNYYEQRINELGQIIKVMTKLISKATQYTSFSMKYKTRSSIIKACQVVPIEKGRALVVVVLGNDLVRNKIVNIDYSIELDTIVRLSNILDRKLSGCRAEGISVIIVNEIVKESCMDRHLILPLVDGIIDCLQHAEEVELYTEGASNLLMHPEFFDVNRAKAVLEVVHDTDIVVQLLKKSAEAGGLMVRIGQENDFDEISDCSIVTATYRINDVELGTIGVLGPTRMDYQKVISSLEYIRKKLNQDMPHRLEGS
jgi:heat-inducible transcriptional repressor